MNEPLKTLGNDAHQELYMEQVRFGRSEQVRRRETPVHVPREHYEKTLRELDGGFGPVYIVDPRLGFNNRTHRFWINQLAPGGEEGKQVWKTLGHRHTVEAVIYWLSGYGHSIIDGTRYDWKPGDVVCVPMFSWHRHVNESDELARYLASTTGPLSMGIGQAVYEDERYPQYFVFAQQGEEAVKALTPGGAGNFHLDDDSHDGLSQSQRLYAEQLLFAAQEEALRRKSRVITKAEEMKFEPTIMGRIAYVVDPRLGFHVKALSALIAEVPRGRHSGSHRHLYDEINYVLAGRGKVIIDDKTYDVEKGDALAIPVFAWHQYFGGEDAPLLILSMSTRPAMENLGLVLTQHGENADYE
jgi:gentisate 1,2-dioxygenase